MEELIHQFLLQSGYPRASIVTDVISLFGSLNGIQPNFIIVDPNTAEPLAVILVVDAVVPEDLRKFASLTGNAARHLRGRAVQGFLIRVDVDGSSEIDQVQFFKVWPGSMLQQLSARTFPDVDSLRVSQKIELLANPESANDRALQAASETNLPEIGAYVPGILLIMIAVVDWGIGMYSGHTFLGTAQSLLLVGAAALLSLPAMLRIRRR